MMMLKLFLKRCIVMFAIFPFYTYGASLSSSPDLDKKMIKSMQGCFEVTFQNAETFALMKPYVYKDRYQSKALEWITVDDEDEHFLSLQHLLIIPHRGSAGGDHSIIKHWRQTWSYEDQSLWDFKGPDDGRLIWEKKWLSPELVKHQWTQKVYQVDDSPRYECSAPWIHFSQHHYWECTTDAPLPRREFTVRQDYQILKRQNRHEIVGYGHIHHEQNTKMILQKDTLLGTNKIIPLVMEQGMNEYKRVEEERCRPAGQWWEKNRSFWKDVQKVWLSFYQEKQQLKIKDKIDQKTLWERVFSMAEQYAENPSYDSAQLQKEIRKLIDLYTE